MPKRCSVCANKRRAEIDATVLEGEASRSVAKRFGVSEWALTRHRLHGHILQSLARAHEFREVERADSLLGQLKALQEEALNILDRAKASDDLRTALAAVGQARECVAILARVMGEIKEAPAVIIQQQISLGPAQIREALGALLDSRAIAIESEPPVEREESVMIEDDDRVSDVRDRCDEPPPQIG